MISKHAENFKHFQITDEDHKRLTPAQIKDLEDFAEEMRNHVVPTTSFDEDKFDASEELAYQTAQRKKAQEP